MEVIVDFVAVGGWRKCGRVYQMCLLALLGQRCDATPHYSNATHPIFSVTNCRRFTAKGVLDIIRRF